MISTPIKSPYCSEHCSSIENYEQAKADPTNTWVIHHRLEIAPDGTAQYSVEELKRKGLYYNRPATELIFLTKSAHGRLHAAATYHSITKEDRLRHRLLTLQVAHDNKLRKYLKRLTKLCAKYVTGLTNVAELEPRVVQDLIRIAKDDANRQRQAKIAKLQVKRHKLIDRYNDLGTKLERCGIEQKLSSTKYQIKQVDRKISDEIKLPVLSWIDTDYDFINAQARQIQKLTDKLERECLQAP